jgi:hypothetical protein
MASSPYCYQLDPDLSDQPSFQDLVAYWRAKAAGRGMPATSDIDALELKRHLGSLNLIDCLPGLVDFRYRLIGTNIAAAYGRDSSGKTVRELYAVSDPEYCAFLLEVYRAVATQPTIARITATLRPVHREYRTAASLVLPLAGPDGSVVRLLNEVLFS